MLSLGGGYDTWGRHRVVLNEKVKLGKLHSFHETYHGIGFVNVQVRSLWWKPRLDKHIDNT